MDETNASAKRPFVEKSARESARPLSPHLSIYKPQLTSGMSIFHKITGIGLAGGLVVLVSWLVSIAMGQEAYETYAKILSHPLALVFMAGWSWALFYHFCNGIRHLLWSVGACLSLRAVYVSGYVALTLSTLFTLSFWAFIFTEGVVSWP